MCGVPEAGNFYVIHVIKYITRISRIQNCSLADRSHREKACLREANKIAPGRAAGNDKDTAIAKRYSN